MVSHRCVRHPCRTVHRTNVADFVQSANHPDQDSLQLDLCSGFSKKFLYLHRVLPEPALKICRMISFIPYMKKWHLSVRCLSAVFSALLLLLTSCMKDNEIGMNFSYPLEISVSGGVFDKDSGLPLEGMNVTLEAFSGGDMAQRIPISSETVLTQWDGTYSFSTSVLSSNLRLISSGKDYRPSEIKLVLSSNSPSYNDSRNSYTVDNQNFYMYK